ncbi:hypothetical protein GCM10022285_39510 [Streptomyces tunisiensis]|uniref:Uncharacterized protein n=1 Tax=Streptomyces tunisiensis TaxID=948699 RepID=A0ABP7YRR8_9ACTN
MRGREVAHGLEVVGELAWGRGFRCRPGPSAIGGTGGRFRQRGGPARIASYPARRAGAGRRVAAVPVVAVEVGKQLRLLVTGGGRSRFARSRGRAGFGVPGCGGG